MSVRSLKSRPVVGLALPPRPVEAASSPGVDAAPASSRRDRRPATVYLSVAEVAFLERVPGDLGWSNRIRRVLRDVMAFFDLPGPVQALLRKDMEAAGCASELEYLHHLLVQQHHRLVVIGLPQP